MNIQKMRKQQRRAIGYQHFVSRFIVMGFPAKTATEVSEIIQRHMTWEVLR